MNEESKALFAKALYIALNEKFDEELASAEIVNSSKKHMRVIKAITREQTLIILCKKKIPLRILVAAIVTLALFLTGCFAALLHRNEFENFIEEIYTDHINLIFGDKSGTISTEAIDNFYELTYLPEGYELVFEDISQGIVFYQYALDENIKITCVDGIFFINNVLEGRN